MSETITHFSIFLPDLPIKIPYFLIIKFFLKYSLSTLLSFDFLDFLIIKLFFKWFKALQTNEKKGKHFQEIKVINSCKSIHN